MILSISIFVGEVSFVRSSLNSEVEIEFRIFKLIEINWKIFENLESIYFLSK